MDIKKQQITCKVDKEFYSAKSLKQKKNSYLYFTREQREALSTRRRFTHRGTKTTR